LNLPGLANRKSEIKIEINEPFVEALAFEGHFDEFGLERVEGQRFDPGLKRQLEGVDFIDGLQRRGAVTSSPVMVVA